MLTTDIAQGSEGSDETHVPDNIIFDDSKRGKSTKRNN